MPTENTISAVAASPVVPPKWSSVMSGKSAEMGEKTSVNTKPHHKKREEPTVAAQQRGSRRRSPRRGRAPGPQGRGPSRPTSRRPRAPDVEPCRKHRHRGEERAHNVERNHGREPPERVDYRRDGSPEDVAARLHRLRHSGEAREVLGRRHERRESLKGGRVQGAADARTKSATMTTHTGSAPVSETIATTALTAAMKRSAPMSVVLSGRRSTMPPRRCRRARAAESPRATPARACSPSL